MNWQVLLPLIVSGIFTATTTIVGAIIAARTSRRIAAEEVKLAEQDREDDESVERERRHALAERRLDEKDERSNDRLMKLVHVLEERANRLQESEDALRERVRELEDARAKDRVLIKELEESADSMRHMVSELQRHEGELKATIDRLTKQLSYDHE